jgi:hypothetical protein
MEQVPPRRRTVRCYLEKQGRCCTASAQLCPQQKRGKALDDTADKGSTGETFICTVRTNEILQPLAAAKGACNAMQA